MKWLNCKKMRSALVVFVTTIVLVGRSVKADFTFGEPTNLGKTINTSSCDIPDCFSSDGLEMYLSSDRPGGYGDWDIWVARRPTIDDDWGAPENIGPPVNTGQSETDAHISVNGLELYFSSLNRYGWYGGYDIWVSKRATKDDNWGRPINLGPMINSASNETSSCLSADGLELYFSSRRSGGHGNDDIWLSIRATVNDPWEDPVNLGSVVNSSASECISFLSSNGLLLLFNMECHPSARSRGFGSVDMWVTTRASVFEPWNTPVNLGPMVNSSNLDCGARISPDGFTAYFSSERPGGFGGAFGDIYQAQIIPIVDFNADGFINTEDLFIMIDNWSTDNSLCDIGPTPWGDGVVDIEDLKVFIKYWEQENMPELTEGIE